MKMWHVADKADSEYSARNVDWSGGYVVLAESAEAAVAMVETERNHEPADYDVRPLPAVYSIPFLGYQW